ncbi:MAG TPA: DUF2252 family protein [Polyangiaceae bacterium]|nr:DUF2252 family protein [Polyangiaceae bacterium]
MSRASNDAQRARVPALHRRRDLKMARDAHAYVRGSTQSFYDWLASGTGRPIPEGPTVWICGDAHVGNLGPIARCDQKVAIELRDLDQTVPGNPALDLVRLALSLAMAARSSDLPGVVTARLVEELMSGYLDAFNDVPLSEDLAGSAAVRFVLREAMRRKWRHLHRERIGKKPKFPLGDRFLPLTPGERADVEQFLDRERVRQLVTALDCRDADAQIRVVDAAYWVKGCSSLGLWRCAALVEVVGHGQRRGGYSLLDIKEAVEPFTPSARPDLVPPHAGQRVVAGTLALSPSLGKRMLSGNVAGHAVFVRELMPQDLKVELEMFSDVEARATARALARVVGAAHARQMDEADKNAWRKQLESASTRWLEAPSWLWNSVVELVGVHERAYLEHCRRYALGVEKQREKAEARE